MRPGGFDVHFVFLRDVEHVRADVAIEELAEAPPLSGGVELPDSLVLAEVFVEDVVKEFVR